MGQPREPLGKQLQRARLKEQALDLFVGERLSTREVGERLGVDNATCWRWYREAMKRHDAETQRSAGEMRARMNLELGRLQNAIWAKALAGDVRAIDTCLRILDRRAKLNGLDRPSETVPSVERVERAVKLIRDSATNEELEAMAAGGAAPAWVQALLPPGLVPEPPMVEIEEVEGGGDIDADWRPVDPAS